MNRCVSITIHEIRVRAPLDQQAHQFGLISQTGLMQRGPLHSRSGQIHIKSKLQQGLSDDVIVLPDGEVQKRPSVHIPDLREFNRILNQYIFEFVMTLMDDQLQQFVMHLLDGVEVVGPHLAIVLLSDDKGLMVLGQFLAVLRLTRLDILYQDLLLLLGRVLLRGLVLGVYYSHWFHGFL